MGGETHRSNLSLMVHLRYLVLAIWPKKHRTKVINVRNLNMVLSDTQTQWVLYRQVGQGVSQ
ncbi:MAG: hypothetical protein CMH52_06795 [Myxococcales bacterium]|nr:hypothetical protein [Myxococcales bacterium]